MSTAIQGIDELLGEQFIPPQLNFKPRYRPEIFALTADDLGGLDANVPEEYRDAELADDMRNILKEWNPVVALVGPPGTGKTRICWATLRRARLCQATKIFGIQDAAQRNYEGAGYESRDTWVKRTLGKVIRNDRVKIISEVADIRRHRHDRDWLDEIAKWGAEKHLLCVDDIGFTGKADDWVMEAIYHLANVRRANALPTLYTTNLSPDDMRNVFGAAISSRILGGVMIPVSGVDRRLA